MTLNTKPLRAFSRDEDVIKEKHRTMLARKSIDNEIYVCFFPTPGDNSRKNVVRREII